MSGLALAGWVALAFGAGSYYALDAAGWFGSANLALGGAALAAAFARALIRARGVAAPAFRGALARGVLGVLLVSAGGVALERLAAAADLRIDWSFERRFELSPATLGALAELAPIQATLYLDAFDPRVRSTRLLLRALAATGHLQFRERLLDESPEDADRFGIASSNMVVLEARGRFETVGRPSEGTFYEALYRLRDRHAGLLYAAHGAGEGQLSRTDGVGYSGLVAALQTEGYRLREFVTATAAEIPGDAEGLLILAPQRRWRPAALAALQRYLARGGRVIAFLEPGAKSGVEEVLADWGIASPDARVVDPASGAVAGDAPGVNPLAFGYADHPVTRGLDASRMTFFHGARSFDLRKPHAEDRVAGVVFSSRRSWLAPPGDFGFDRAPVRPPDAQEAHRALVAAGRYTRDGREARIVAFGDASLASNHYLRALYNLDLVLNAVHWALAREPEITIRPKAGVSGRLQLPLPIQATFTMLQGVGLLLPELLLLGGVWAYARSRNG